METSAREGRILTEEACSEREGVSFLGSSSLGVKRSDIQDEGRFDALARMFERVPKLSATLPNGRCDVTLRRLDWVCRIGHSFGYGAGDSMNGLLAQHAGHGDSLERRAVPQWAGRSLHYEFKMYQVRTGPRLDQALLGVCRQNALHVPRTMPKQRLTSSALPAVDPPSPSGARAG